MESHQTIKKDAYVGFFLFDSASKKYPDAP